MERGKDVRALRHHRPQFLLKRTSPPPNNHHSPPQIRCVRKPVTSVVLLVACGGSEVEGETGGGIGRREGGQGERGGGEVRESETGSDDLKRVGGEGKDVAARCKIIRVDHVNFGTKGKNVEEAEKTGRTHFQH
jgi:hypothetical protein